MLLIKKFSKYPLSVKLILLYWIIVGFSWLTNFTPLGKCSDYMCFPISSLLILIPALPGFEILKIMAPGISPHFASWMTRGENFLQVLLISYAVTSLLIILLGLFITSFSKNRIKYKNSRGTP